jgi:hypothetical protein
MKITFRQLVVIACAWCAMPLLGVVLDPAGQLRIWTLSLLNESVVAVRFALLVIGAGAFARAAWVRPVAMANAVACTVLLVALGIAATIRPAAFFPLEIVATPIAGSWVVALAARRLRVAQAPAAQASRSFSSSETGENRLIWGGVALIAAWVLVWPRLVDHSSPLREVSATVWKSDASHVRVVIPEGQRSRMSPQQLRIVDDINVDIGRIAAGQPPVHAEATERHGDSTKFIVRMQDSAWYLMAYSQDGKVVQINLGFFNAPDLVDRIGERQFLLR